MKDIKMQLVKDKLNAMRGVMGDIGINGFIVPQADEYLSEYTPACAKRLEWLTGFTGSSGTAVILPHKALIITDGRYIIQVKNQVDTNMFDIKNIADTNIADWIKENSKSGDIIGYDAELHTAKQINDILEQTNETGITFKPVNKNIVDLIWHDKPPFPYGIIELFPDDVAGRTSTQKRQLIADKLKSDNVDACVLTACDGICWLLNVRGDDVAYNPVVLSRAILNVNDASVDWFVDKNKLTNTVINKLGTDIKIHAPDTWFDFLKNLNGTVQIDPQRAPYAVLQALESARVKTTTARDPCIIPKACKTSTEQLAIRQAHIRDGLAVVRFLYWLDCQNLKHGHVDELLIESKLEEYRRACKTYRSPSFSTIAGWCDHGAIIHYHANTDTNYKIMGDGLLLIDSGGQYEYGTTDITRTVVLGQITDKMREHFTRCLKGHIAVATAKFTEGTIGADIDKLARISLLEGGVDYAHSTGHGVGCFLSVHEDAAPISPRGQEMLRAGMLLSNEPGCYIDGEYGIRHESLMFVVEEDKGELSFDTITLVPFDLKGIDWKLITPQEKQWLYNYHKHVFDMLVPFLDETEIDWLKTFVNDKNLSA